MTPLDENLTCFPRDSEIFSNQERVSSGNLPNLVKSPTVGSSQEKKKSDLETQFRPSYLNGVFVSTHEHLSKNRNNNKNINIY